jgi:cell wall-associated NlpC family hydrolase
MTSATPVVAAPTSGDKLAEATRVKAQVEALDNRVEIAAERYNGASVKHDKLVSEQKKAKKRVVKAQNRIGVLQKNLNTRANDMYRAGPLGIVDVLLGAQDFEQFAATWDILKELNTKDANNTAEMKVVRAEAKSAHAQVTEKERAAAKQLAIMKSNKAQVEAQLAERKRKLAGVEAEVAALQAQEEAVRAAASRAAAARYSSGDGGGDANFPPPQRAPRSEIVSVARKYLGARYVWGATGPNTFDCSGFTSYVYRQVGVSIPRVSRDQINAGERVSRKDLAPGDLVFFGSPIHHVGMYIGGGMMIHAPNSGSYVKIAPAFRSNYVGACRP